MATIPATTKTDGVPTSDSSHMWTPSPEMSGANVKPIVHANYDGRDLVLPDDPSAVLRVSEIPALAEQHGPRHRHRSGTTLLGADNKAGVAEIVTAAAYLVEHPEIPHGPIRIGFTPDEEIGRGTQHFDVARFGGGYAYTMDGSSRGELEMETFSADAITVTFHGFNTQAGYAKGRMINAIKLAAAFSNSLPRGTMSPRPPTATKDSCTLRRAGRRRADVGQAAGARLRHRGAQGQGSARRAARARIVAAHPGRASRSTVEEQYRNMKEVLDHHRPSSSTRAKRSAARDCEPRRARFAAAPTARACRSWGCRRRTSSPASTTSTRGSNGCRCRTWRRRSR
jgi:tripeptide aminopeptidase